jgi:hypothetical protein
MTTTINAALSGGLINSADTSGILQLQTASTAAITITAAQNVGIGTASPAYKLDVNTTGAPIANLNSTATDGGYVVFGSGSTPTYIGSQKAILATGNASDFIILGTGSNNFLLGSNSTERMRLPAAGGVQAVTTISVGNATPSSSGAGITFPSTQSASSDANTLDDYEEGTYTATMTPAGGSFTMDTARDTLQYVKIGRMVYIQGYIRTATVSSPTGTITINLPFTANAGTEFSGYTSGTVIPENITSGTSNGFGLIVGPSGSTATISYTAGGGTAASWDACAQKFTGNTNVTISLSYQASA